jgi:hypothetical protein
MYALQLLFDLLCTFNRASCSVARLSWTGNILAAIFIWILVRVGIFVASPGNGTSPKPVEHIPKHADRHRWDTFLVVIIFILSFLIVTFLVIRPSLTFGSNRSKIHIPHRHSTWHMSLSLTLTSLVITRLRNLDHQIVQPTLVHLCRHLYKLYNSSREATSDSRVCIVQCLELGPSIRIGYELFKRPLFLAP